jgi:CubicO group peptidase (beta-lactamase class C family)
MTTAQRLRRWGRRLAYLGGSVAVLLFLAWVVVLIVTERAAGFTGPRFPSTIAVADSRYEQSIQKARDQVQAMMAECRIPGLSLAVAVDGRVVWSEGFGLADRERRMPATPATRFRVASVSKLFTAAGMARLYEAGRLDLDRPIQTYVPSFPDKGQVITARQLASHRAGIRNYRDDWEAIHTKPSRSVIESLETFRDDRLRFPPDRGFLYSGYGYVLLSAALEGAAGEDFLAAMNRWVFGPLGMDSTGPDRLDEPAPNQSRCYDHETPFSPDGTVVESPRNDFSCKWAAGGFRSTAEDLVRFGSAHMTAGNEGFLRPETLRLLFTPRSSQAGILGYGLGWMTARDPHLRRAHFHFGAGSGGSSLLVIYPEQKVCVALAANLGHAKFPYNRLMGIVNPFLPDPARYVIALVLAGLALASLIVVRRLWRRRGVQLRHIGAV